MDSAISDAVQSCVARLLTPLVRVLLRYGIPFGVFMDVAKRIYVDAAMEEFAIPGRKSSISRASVITGLSRKEISRVKRLPSLAEDRLQDSYNRATRVISGWVRDPAFADARGEPAALPLEGAENSFSRLVRIYSGDVPARAILDELLRVGAVERLESGEIRLRSRAYIPSEGEEEKISILGNDVADLISTIDHNLQSPESDSLFQLKVSYDNLPREPLKEFRSLSSNQALELLERFDKELSSLDRDVNPASEGTGRVRAGISIYYFEEEIPDQGKEDQS
ncbi:MAG: DUF6502 family protein [SAR324 cluster bacterium]|nr:DUF6502 family protein [SAR324 cluster bacterium]